MRIQLIKPAPGWGASEGSVIDIPEVRAMDLIKNGFGKLVEQPVKHFTQLAVEKAILNKHDFTGK